MLLNKIRPNWMHIHSLKDKPFIHFNLQTFGLNHVIPYDFVKSYNYLPPDQYVKKVYKEGKSTVITYDGKISYKENEEIVTRSRRYCNLKIDVSDNYLYRINYTKNNIFKQNVDDSRSVEREFELMDIYHINQPWLTEFLTQISALSVLNHNYYKGHKKIKEVDIHLHQVRQTTYPTIDAHNSPEGIHRDGADYIVSAFIINRNNILGGESTIYDQNKEVSYKTKLSHGEGIYQEDIKQWHYVSPIECEQKGLGFRDILGIDLILNH